jgi:uncharacterized protein (DUF488 family)
MKPLATIGYENATVASVLDRLRDAKVEIVIDVRAVTSSRRPGFSKNALAAALDEAGIAYVHLRALGTPSAGRTAARAGRTEEMHRIFLRHLAEPEAQAALGEAQQMATRNRACLLCYEADAAKCHRALIAQEIEHRTRCRIDDL